MVLSDLISIFPTLFFFWAYCVLLILMLVSLVTGFLGNLELPFEFDIDVETEASSLSILDIFFPQRLAQLPLLVSLSIVFFIATVISYLIQDFLIMLPGIFYWIAAVIALFVIFFISLHLASWALKPFSSFLDQKKAFATVNYIGMTGAIKTTKVTANFGEISIKDHSGREDYLNVYCDENLSSSPLTYGDLALIVSFNETKKRFLVIKVDSDNSADSTTKNTG